MFSIEKVYLFQSAPFSYIVNTLTVGLEKEKVSKILYCLIIAIFPGVPEKYPFIWDILNGFQK